jgi:hypothetical protein
VGYNQVKGQNLYGKFEDGKLQDVDIGRMRKSFILCEMKKELIGINKKCK